MQAPRLPKIDEANAPGLESVLQKIRYCLPCGSVYIVSLSSGHRGPLGAAEDEVGGAELTVDATLLLEDGAALVGAALDDVALDDAALEDTALVGMTDELEIVDEETDSEPLF